MQKLSRRRLAGYIAAEVAAGSLKQATIQKVAAYLVENKQADTVDLVLSDVATILAKRYGVVSAEVSSATVLDDSLRSAITEFVKRTENAKTVQMTETIDKSLIGGIIIRTPSAELDGSIRSQLRQLRALSKRGE